MRLLAVAGEPSGDLRGSELLRELSGLEPSLECFGLGGDLLASAGMEILFHLSHYSVMGFAEVLGSIPAFRRLEKGLRESCLSRRPDAVLLVDYPGFNLRFARWARRTGLPVIYYVSPQLWAWGGWRVSSVRRNVDLMITLFEFERDFYAARGVRSVWAGHPLAGQEPDGGGMPGNSLALLPGSRRQEVDRLLPAMLGAWHELRERGVAGSARIAVSGTAGKGCYGAAGTLEGVELCDSIPHAMDGSAAALVCSGTATLEAAVLGVPFVVCYRTSFLTYVLARLLVRGVSRIGMANIVAGTDVAPELIQGDATAPAMADAVEPLMTDPGVRARALDGLGLVRRKLGPPGGAARAAAAVSEFLGG